MKHISSKAITGSFSIALLLLSGVIVTFYLSIKQSNEDKKLVIHSYQVRETLQDMDSALIGAENQRQGYILNGGISYIDNYHQDKQKVYTALQKLQYLTRDNLKQQHQLNKIKPLINKRFFFLEKVSNSSTKITIAQKNISLQAAIESIFQAMKEEEDSLLQMRMLQTSRSVHKIILLVAFAYGLGIILLTSVYILLQKQIYVDRKHAKLQLANFLEGTTDAFVALDKNWHYTYVNQRAAELFNRVPEELVGKHIWKEFPEGIGQKFYNVYYQAVAEQRMMQIEEYYPPWNRWYENRVYPSKDGLSIFFQDITERKQLELALRHQIDFDQLVARISTRFINITCSEIPVSINLALQEIGEFSQVDTSFITKFSDDKTIISMIYEWVAPGFVPHFNDVQNLPSNTFPWANARGFQGNVVYFAKLEDLPAAAAIDRENWRHANIKSLISIPLTYEGNVFAILGFATFEQEKTWSDSSVRLLKIVGEIFTNALQRQESEIELQQQEQRWQLAIQGNKDGIWDHDLISGRHFLSPRCREMLGYENNEVTTFDKWFALIHPRDKEVLTKAFEAHLGRQTVYYSSEYRMRCKDGSYKWLLARGQALWNNAGIPIRAVGSITDVTERKIAEAAISQLNKKLETKVKLRTAALQKLNQELLRSNQELEQFASVASHDLQEPLRAVIGFTQLLKAKQQEHTDESTQRYMNIIIDAGQRMHQLINDLLAYSRVSTRSHKFISIDSSQALNQAINNLQVAISESQAIITHDVLPIIVADKTQLVQVFQNLIANAIKFCEQQPRIHIGVKQEGNKYLFWVEDNGIGIKEEYMNSIFEIFRRLHTRNEYSGTGIGLAICKKIIELHGGTIWATSKPKVGTTFYFTFTTP